MKLFKPVLFLAGLAAASVPAFAQDFAPTNLASVIFNGTITSATGGANGAGTFSTLLASNGFDYTLSPDGMLSEPVAYTYTKSSPTTGTFTEAASGSQPSVSVALTFDQATGGNFVATYVNGSTQRGSFTLVPIASSSPLANVSARTTLAANGSAITGFVIGGAGPRRVLIRAVGPGLTQFGVSNVLANPTIMLWRGNQSIGGNDDYASGSSIDATLPSVFNRVGAFGLAAGSRDAALVTTLDPGAYTAQIRGVTATETGEVLLEVYFLD